MKNSLDRFKRMWYNPDMRKEKYLSIAQVARQLGISRAAVYEAIKKKHIKAKHEKIGRLIISELEIKNYKPINYPRIKR